MHSSRLFWYIHGGTYTTDAIVRCSLEACCKVWLVCPSCDCLSNLMLGAAAHCSRCEGRCRSLLGVGLELGSHLPLLELLSEALVIGPEQADVWNVKEDHSQPLQPKTAGAAQSGGAIGVSEAFSSQPDPCSVTYSCSARLVSLASRYSLACCRVCWCRPHEYLSHNHPRMPL